MLNYKFIKLKKFYFINNNNMKFYLWNSIYEILFMKFYVWNSIYEIFIKKKNFK